MRHAVSHLQLSQMMTDIDMSVFAIRFRLASFTAALLNGMTDHAVALDLPIVCGECGSSRIVRCGGIYLDPDHGLIMVSAAVSGEDLAWDELTLASQHLIAQDLSTRYLAADIYSFRA
jgi:hypothetical protein